MEMGIKFERVRRESQRFRMCGPPKCTALCNHPFLYSNKHCNVVVWLCFGVLFMSFKPGKRLFDVVFGIFWKYVHINPASSMIALIGQH